MRKDRANQYKNKMRKTGIGMVFSILIFIVSPYAMSLFSVRWRLDGLLYTVGFLSLLYFGIFSLKCPQCHVSIYLGDAFSIKHCKKCGLSLRRDQA